ncbi:hypothetical protein ICW40_20040, partial [Actinotalea ferrariae]|uniref:hypothetical protein n=1 Tax=Actinotalea ferrariae TaxID=1386098 RepID=UPI001C8B805C
VRDLPAALRGRRVVPAHVLGDLARLRELPQDGGPSDPTPTDLPGGAVPASLEPTHREGEQ